MAETHTKMHPFLPTLKLRYGWLSSFFGLFLVAYFFVMSEPELIAFYQVPTVLFDYKIKAALTAIFFIFLIHDVHQYGRDRKKNRKRVQRFQDEVDQLWDSRKKLQHKVHTYAGHADKLKLFISDKLLEYIEYDEKFLHFKSIAAEVRHNGVIGFDKVQTLLKSSLERLREGDADYDVTRDALDQLRYLWDLLDLATTDNIALHIANQLCDLEEQYYQQALDPDAASTQALQPDFSPVTALARALMPLLEDNSGFKQALAQGLPLRWTEDSNFRVEVQPCGALLGLENHWVLLLENLLKNAQFFSGKRPYRHKYRRVAVNLAEYQGRARVTVFNGGPPISEADQAKVFQLGYSTRRVKEHHGKGLGLFFVGEIVKGYEGRIQINNIQNTAGWLSIRVTLTDGRVFTQMVDILLEDELPRCRLKSDDLPDKQLDFEYEKAIASIEVTSAGQTEPHSLVLEGRQDREVWLDPAQPGRPAWVLEIHNRSRQGRMSFQPLDVRGVEFCVDVPLAETRLAGEDLDALEEVDVDRLNEPFRALAPDDAPAEDDASYPASKKF